MARSGRGRWWRWLLVVALSVCALLAFVAVLLQTPLAREQLRVQVNAALAEAFQGRLEIERIGDVGLSGVRGVDARVFDPAGQQVIRVQGLSALAWLPGLAWQFLAGGEEPELLLARVHADHVEVTLREDEELGVSIAGTFLPREPPPQPEASPAGGPRLRIERVSVERIWAHGRAAGAPPLDADLTELEASLEQSPQDGFSLELEGAVLRTRALPAGVDPRGELRGRVEAPADDALPLRLEAMLEGRAAESPLSLEVSWVGDDLFAQVTLARLPAELVNRQAPGLALDGELLVTAEIYGTLPELDYFVELDSTAARLEASGHAALSGGLEISAQLAAARVDLARIAEGAPESDLRARVDAWLFEEDAGQFAGGYAVALDRGAVAGQATPAAWLGGSLALSPEGDFETSGRLSVAEPGAPLAGRYRAALPAEAPGEVALSIRGDLADPPRLRAFGVSTAGELALTASVKPESRVLAAELSLDLRRLDYQQLQARSVQLRGTASGSADDPRVRATTTLELLSGRARAELDYSARRQSLRLSAAGIDLVRLSNALQVELPLERGIGELEASLERTPRSPAFVLNGHARADFGKVGVVQAAAKDFEVPASAPSLSRLGSLRGEVSAGGKLDLGQLPALIELADLPLERTAGQVRFALSAKQRPQDGQGLELTAELDTNGLRIVQQRPLRREVTTTDEAVADEPLALEGVDLRLALRVLPQRGEAVGTLLLRDPGGLLAEAQAEARIAEVWPHALADRAALERMPLSVWVEVPRRRLQSLPPLLRPAALRGRVSAEAALSGSIAEPDVKARLALEGFRTRGAREPLDIVADVGLTRAGGKLQATARAPKGGDDALALGVEWKGDVRRAAQLEGGEPALVADASARLSEFPLDAVPLLFDRQVTGRLSGQVQLRDWGKAARLDVGLGSTSVRVGKMAIRELKVAARAEGGKLSASADVRAEGGSAQASFDGSARWGKLPLPELERRGVVKLSTRAFRLETLSPLVGAYVSELGGVLDASMQIAVAPTTTALSGSAKLERGVVHLPAVGQRFSDITARVEVGNDQLRLEGLEARGLTGRVTATGAARLDGFALRSADARVSIKKQEMLPITLEGVAIGDAWGEVSLAYQSPERGARRLEVDVREFHLITAETSSYGVQGLERAEDVRVGVRRADGAFVALPVQPLEPGGSSAEDAEPQEPLLIRVKLGPNVTVARGRAAQAQLTGGLEILSAEETRVTGRIEVRGGKLDVSGKTFEIERGVVTFDGKDPGNPDISATARWDAPEYTVYADYVGDVENGRIKLRSEPPLTQDEIASLLLFGDPDGSVGGGDSSNAALAVSVAGGTATQGLNRALDDFTNLDVSTRIDTTTGSARPELVVQVSPRVAAKVTRAIGAPAAGESPDRTFLTLELRLRRAWALSAVFGDHGASALDLIWRRRY